MSNRRVRGAGGKSARRAARTSHVIDTAKFIERNIPNLELLNLESLEIIEEKAKNKTLIETNQPDPGSPISKAALVNCPFTWIVS